MPELIDQLEACRAIGTYLDERTLAADTEVAQLVIATYERASDTFASMTCLMPPSYTVQGAMLARSLFEDVAVSHWLVLNEEDPDWLLQRFFRHRAAMRLHEARVRRSIGWDIPDVSDISDDEDELKTEFGLYAQRDWWGIRKDGTKLSMAALVEILTETSRFQPRLKGEQPIFMQIYSSIHKLNTQCLHHTAVGLKLHLDSAGRAPVVYQPLSEFEVLFAGYWLHAQLIYLTLEVAGEDAREFESLFLHGLYNVLGRASHLPEELKRARPPSRPV